MFLIWTVISEFTSAFAATTTANSSSKIGKSVTNNTVYNSSYRCNQYRTNEYFQHGTYISESHSHKSTVSKPNFSSNPNLFSSKSLAAYYAMQVLMSTRYILSSPFTTSFILIFRKTRFVHSQFQCCSNGLLTCKRF